MVESAGSGRAAGLDIQTLEAGTIAEGLVSSKRQHLSPYRGGHGVRLAIRTFQKLKPSTASLPFSAAYPSKKIFLTGSFLPRRTASNRSWASCVWLWNWGGKFRFLLIRSLHPMNAKNPGSFVSYRGFDVCSERETGFEPATFSLGSSHSNVSPSLKLAFNISLAPHIYLTLLAF